MRLINQNINYPLFTLFLCQFSNLTKRVNVKFKLTISWNLLKYQTKY